ncbi:MAG: hypothetical protein KBC53_12145, partial [Nitrosomonas sp.]|nr:hypothetical protein [Nitrosomonas sp.]
NADLNLAIKAALKAGEIIRTNYHNTAEKNAAAKGYQGDLVTETDVECDNAIQEILRKTKYNILSEEINNETREDGNRLWVVDPLDGTAGFIHKHTTVPAVMIALREQFETVLSVVLRPLTNELFYAVEGKGAYRNGKRVWTDPNNIDLANAWVAMNHYGDIALQTGLFSTADASLRSTGGASMTTRPVPYSGIALDMLGDGETLAAVIHDNNHKKPKQGPWDIIPIELLIREAGGVVCYLEDGAPVDPYNARPFIVAANQAMATAIINRVHITT